MRRALATGAVTLGLLVPLQPWPLPGPQVEQLPYRWLTELAEPLPDVLFAPPVRVLDADGHRCMFL